MSSLCVFLGYIVVKRGARIERSDDVKFDIDFVIFGNFDIIREQKFSDQSTLDAIEIR